MASKNNFISPLLLAKWRELLTKNDYLLVLSNKSLFLSIIRFGSIVTTKISTPKHFYSGNQEMLLQSIHFLICHGANLDTSANNPHYYLCNDFLQELVLILRPHIVYRNNIFSQIMPIFNAQKKDKIDIE